MSSHALCKVDKILRPVLSPSHSSPDSKRSSTYDSFALNTEMPPTSSSGRKRIREITEDATDGDYQPSRPNIPEATHSNPPPAQQKRTSKRNETVSIPSAYQSERDHSVFSKPWWREVTQRDEFWVDFRSKVAPSTIQRRFKAPPVEVVTNTNSKTTATSKPAAKSVVRAAAPHELNTAQSSSSLLKQEEPSSRSERLLCSKCNLPATNGGSECDECIATQDDDPRLDFGTTKTKSSEPNKERCSTDMTAIGARESSVDFDDCGDTSMDLATPPLQTRSSPQAPKFKSRYGIWRKGKLIEFDQKDVFDIKVEQDPT